MIQSVRHRAFTRAAQHWNAGEYAAADDILMAAGIDRHDRDEFFRFAQKRNRDRYVRIMTRYQP